MHAIIRSTMVVLFSIFSGFNISISPSGSSNPFSTKKGDSGTAKLSHKMIAILLLASGSVLFSFSSTSYGSTARAIAAEIPSLLLETQPADAAVFSPEEEADRPRKRRRALRATTNKPLTKRAIRNAQKAAAQQYERAQQALTQARMAVTEIPQGWRPPSADWTLQKDGTSIIFLHVGKAGGGSLWTRRNEWKVQPRYCHPEPCSWEITENEGMPPPEKTALMISIRDPVDRFHSDFYWRYMDPWKEGWPLPANRAKYHDDANEVAEALCSSDPKVAAEARWDMTHFDGHTSWTLADWLLPSTISDWNGTKTWNTTNDWRNYKDSILPIVQEEGFSLFRQMDKAIMWAFKERMLPSVHRRDQLQEARDFVQRELYVQARDKMTRVRARKKVKHNTATVVKQPLSPLGEKCLAEFYAKDYEIIQQLLDAGACKYSQTCENAINSILERHQARLSYTNDVGTIIKRQQTNVNSDNDSSATNSGESNTESVSESSAAVSNSDSDTKSENKEGISDSSTNIATATA